MSDKVQFKEFNSQYHYKSLNKKVFMKDMKTNVKFLNVRANIDKIQLISLTNCLPDASSFLFWISTVDLSFWGLTIKAYPKKNKEKSFIDTHIKNGRSHIWKCTWFNNEECYK